MKKAVIGIDLGTTLCKSVIFDEELNIISQAHLEYDLIKKSRNEIEQDPEQWWEVVKKTIIDALYKAKFDFGIIKSISVTSQGIAFVPVDNNCIPLCNAISWLDSRAWEEREILVRKYGLNGIFSITGKPLNEYYILPKLMWLKKNHPEILERIYKILTAHDFIIARLSGKFITDHTMASGSMAYDIKRCDWSKEILEDFGLKLELFPEILKSGTPVGVIREAVAEELGLKNNVMVVTGGQDQKCAALGAGINIKAATVSLGTSTAITRISEHAVFDPNMLIPCFKGLAENEWVIEGAIATSCACLNWLKETLLVGYSSAQFDGAVADSYGMENSVFFYPFLTGSGALTHSDGLKSCFYGLTLATNTSEIIRSVYEGITYQIRFNIELMEELNGHIDELIIYGGGSKSDIWCRMISDITNKRVLVLQDAEVACRGAAMLAGVGIGIFKNTGEAIKKTRFIQTFEPDQNKSNMYKSQYCRYLKFQNIIKDF